MPESWESFRGQFTKDQGAALWQYFLDHSRIQKNGFFGIMFYIRDMDDFWKRVHARYTGEFQRYDKLRKEHLQENKGYFMWKRQSRKQSEIATRIDKEGSLKEKATLWTYRKSRESLFKNIKI